MASEVSAFEDEEEMKEDEDTITTVNAEELSKER